MFIFIKVFFLFFVLQAFSNANSELPSSIDSIFQKNSIQGTYIGTSTFGHIELKLLNGEEVSTFPIDGITDLTPFSSGDSIKIMYSLKSGIKIIAKKDEAISTLVSGYGFEENHPITWAISKCISTNSSKNGYFRCNHIGYEAWDVELNRAYKLLGGKNNKLLKQSQLDWIKYRDSSISFLESHYLEEESGWSNSLTYEGHVLRITRRQALFLLEIYGW